MYYARELAHHLLKSGFVKSERIAASEAAAIIDLVTNGYINELRTHIHYAVECTHPEFRRLAGGCLTNHTKHRELHAVCLTCQKYLWGPNGEYPE